MRASRRRPCSRMPTNSASRGCGRRWLRARAIDEEALRRHCAQQLGGAFAPAHFAVVESLPLNEGGKLDRSRLAALAGCRPARANIAFGIAADLPAAPRTEVVRKLSAVAILQQPFRAIPVELARNWGNRAGAVSMRRKSICSRRFRRSPYLGVRANVAGAADLPARRHTGEGAGRCAAARLQLDRVLHRHSWRRGVARP